MKAQRQAKGFTLVELIIVIVILGIISAVAIPKFSTSSSSARAAVQDATLGALKSAWSVAYANAGGNPTLANVLSQMADPTCTVTTSPAFTCTGVQKQDGSGLVTFTATADPVTSPASITFSGTR